MSWLTQTIGTVFIIVAAIAIFITFLYTCTGNSIVSLHPEDITDRQYLFNAIAI